MSITTYTVEVHPDCRIVRGPVPMSDMSKLLAMEEGDGVVDIELANQIGATLVFGSREGIARLRAVGMPLSPERFRQVGDARSAGLSDAAIAWVSRGERGTSSESIFSHLTGIALLATKDYDLPHDPSDFGRCRKLLEAVPELIERVPRLAELGFRWQELVDRWQEIADLMDTEAPNWRAGDGASRSAFAVLQAITR